jgi:RNA polymerase sigma-54 factor
MSEMNLSNNLEISQTIELLLSPRMIQMLKMLNMSYMDMVEEINQKSEENVMLEIEKHDRLFEYIKTISTERIPKKDISGEELPGVEALAETSDNLFDHLIKQLDLLDVDEKERSIAESLIGELDEKGYLSNYKETKKEIVGHLNVNGADVDAALEIVQSLEPEGVGARDLKECLLIQIREYNFESPELEGLLIKAVSDHLDGLANKEYGPIARALKINEDGVAKIAEYIKNNLTPTPGHKYADKSPCIIPSFFIKKENDKYAAVNLERTYGPVLKISPQYQKMLNDPKTDKESIEFLKKKLSDAKDFLDTIEKRHSTIEKIIKRIVSTQEKFFEKGELEMSPLMQKDIANELGLHPSTISRAISNKYVQTPKGVFSLKFLCPREVKGITSDRIESLIKETIKTEKSSTPMTDEQVAKKLSENGINIKRRTVSAYRQKLGLGTVKERVKFPKDKADN